MGCYPLFACSDWTALRRDLEELSPKLVSVVLVTDPFGAFQPADVRACFPDRMAAFKEHFVVDLRQPLGAIGTPHHRRNVRKGLDALAVDLLASPAEASAEWTQLYAQLIARHRIRGAAAFSPASLTAQLEVPGLVALRARSGAETVGMTLWYVDGNVGYYHLAAYSEQGYRLRASYALFWRAFEHLAERGIQRLSLGAHAGADAESRPGDGLDRFKSGWATATRTVYLCGRVLDREKYFALAAATGTVDAPWFPAYRAPAVR